MSAEKAVLEIGRSDRRASSQAGVCTTVGSVAYGQNVMGSEPKSPEVTKERPKTRRSKLIKGLKGEEKEE